MIPARIEGANAMYGAPEGWDEARDGLCGVLPVRVQRPYHISAWTPLPEELAALNAGAAVHLYLMVPRQPVVAVSVGPVPDDAALNPDPPA